MSQGAPLVTVMITAYNGKTYIDRAIRSVLVQTHPNIEILLVDDASTDGTADHVENSYAGSVSLIRNETNLGPSGSRNRAIENARGDWIMQLDGDDWIAPERVQRLLQVAEEFRADVVSDDQLLVLDITEKPVGSRFIDNGVSCRAPRVLGVDEFVRRDLGSLKPLMRRQFLLESEVRYPVGVRYGEDFLFLYDLLRKGARFVLVPEVLYFLRRGNTGSLTTKREQLFSQLLDMNEKLRISATDAGDDRLVAALLFRKERLARLRDAELAVQKIRASRLPNLSEIFPLAIKTLRKIAEKSRLAMLLLSHGKEIQRRISAVS